MKNQEEEEETKKEDSRTMASGLGFLRFALGYEGKKQKDQAKTQGRKERETNKDRWSKSLLWNNRCWIKGESRHAHFS